MQRYSLLNVIRHALQGNEGCEPAWRDAEPRSSDRKTMTTAADDDRFIACS